jgi:hypothetical protein
MLIVELNAFTQKTNWQNQLTGVYDVTAVAKRLDYSTIISMKAVSYAGRWNPFLRR